MTRGLISLSEGLRDYFWLLLPGVLGLVLLLRGAWRQPALRLCWHAWLLRAPLA
ncbi:hypothetical protein PF70_06803, partial [Pseudomonas asplenii]